MACKNPLHLIACILLVIGGLNWGVVAIGQLLNIPTLAVGLVELLFGNIVILKAIIYLLVAASAVVVLLQSVIKGCQCEHKPSVQ